MTQCDTMWEGDNYVAEQLVADRVWLLDLNYTLVENSREKKHPFTKQIEHERYRSWLVDLLKATGYPIVLVTARPAKYEAHTMDSIYRKLGWMPDLALFNEDRLSPPVLKPLLISEHVFPTWGLDPSTYVAIESNPRTRVAYHAMGVATITAPKGLETWKELPEPYLPTT